jgi:hypothetical protein
LLSRGPPRAAHDAPVTRARRDSHVASSAGAEEGV